MEDPSCTALSEFSSACVSSSSHIQVSDVLSQEGVLAGLVQDMNELEVKFNSFVEQYSKHRNSAERSSLSGYSRSFSEDSSEILMNKGHFIQKLTDAVENSDPIDVPKHKIHCYQELSSLITKRFNECEQSKYQIEKQVNKQKSESEELSSQIKIFSNLPDDELNNQETEEDSVQSKILFQEAKKDMETVLSTLFPKEVKKEFETIMGLLVPGFMNNTDYEDQFIEIPTDSLSNEGLQCLLRGYLVVQHPLIPTKLRLNM